MIIHEFFRDTVNGRNPAPVEVGSLSHYLMTGFIHSRWLGMGFLNHQPYVHSESTHFTTCSLR